MVVVELLLLLRMDSGPFVRIVGACTASVVADSVLRRASVGPKVRAAVSMGVGAAVWLWTTPSGTGQKNKRSSEYRSSVREASKEASDAFARAVEASKQLKGLDSKAQLRVYALYKVATKGPCNVPAPSAISMVARAKWDAWNDMGDMSSEAAMQEYARLVAQLGAGDAGNDGPSSNSSRGSAGSAFRAAVSTMAPEEGAKWENHEELLRVASEGDAEGVRAALRAGASINGADDDGCTALHWACDRGHKSIVELLLARGADIAAADVDGATPLHYALSSDRDDCY